MRCSVPTVQSYLFSSHPSDLWTGAVGPHCVFRGPRPFLAGQLLLAVLDNSNCLVAVVRGDSNAEIIAIFAPRFLAAGPLFNVCFRFSCVKPKLNPAAPPTRDQKMLPYLGCFLASVSLFGRSFQALSFPTEEDTPESAPPPHHLQGEVPKKNFLSNRR